MAFDANTDKNEIEKQIMEIRNEIQELWIDLGNKNKIADFWKPMQSENYDENLVKIHENKRDELEKDWSKITDDLDSFLASFENQTNENTNTKHQNINNGNKNENNNINNNNNNNNNNTDSNNNSFLQWSDNGNVYSLAPEKELMEQRAKFAEKLNGEREEFRQFRQSRRSDLEDIKRVSETCTVEIYDKKKKNCFSGAVFFHDWVLHGDEYDDDDENDDHHNQQNDNETESDTIMQ